MSEIENLINKTERLLVEATPGPWKVDEVTGCDVDDGYEGSEIVSRGIDGPEGVGLNTGVEYQMYSQGDAALIAHARAALPELCAEVRRLRARLENSWAEVELLTLDYHEMRANAWMLAKHIESNTGDHGYLMAWHLERPAVTGAPVRDECKEGGA